MGHHVLIVVSDLMFEPRISAAARALGCTTDTATTAAEVAAAMAAQPALVVVDLHIDGLDAIDAIAQAKSGGAAVLAFGRHTDPATLRAARDAGAGRAVARSQLVEELPALITALLPPAGAHPR